MAVFLIHLPSLDGVERSGLGTGTAGGGSGILQFPEEEMKRC